ncbi:MAG TPA: hypothetical protein ENJ08_15160 [Gammaproteobacteria bacterium]|nr:hypothetical protein [Gammaproteobacteria bacterium]
MLKTSIKALPYIVTLLAINTAAATEPPTIQLNIENTNLAYTQCIKNIVDTRALSCTGAINCGEKRVATQFKNEAINLNCLKQHGGPVIVYSYRKHTSSDKEFPVEQIANRQSNINNTLSFSN